MPYTVDAVHLEAGILLEVEEGRATMGNAVRDLIESSLVYDAEYLALLVPQKYRYRAGLAQSYRDCYWSLNAIYGSQRLKLPLEGVLLVGY